MYYLTDKDPRMLVGLGGSEQDVVGSLGTSIVAIDYQTGKLAWKYRLTGGSGTGLLTTAGGLLFANDGSGSLVRSEERRVGKGWGWGVWGGGRRRGG